jgi:hypothetical protein
MESASFFIFFEFFRFEVFERGTCVQTILLGGVFKARFRGFEER